MHNRLVVVYVRKNNPYLYDCFLNEDPPEDQLPGRILEGTGDGSTAEGTPPIGDGETPAEEKGSGENGSGEKKPEDKPEGSPDKPENPSSDPEKKDPPQDPAKDDPSKSPKKNDPGNDATPDISLDGDAK